MSPGYEEAPDRGSGALQNIGTTTDRLNSSRPTQRDRVLAVLLANDEVCGSELYAMYIPRFGAHLHRLRKQGYLWSKRPCDRHDHEGTQWLYNLEALPYDSSDRAA